MIGKKSSKQTSGPSAYAKPYITGAVNTLQSTVNANQPRTQAIADQIGGYLPGLGAKVFGDNPMYDAAERYTSDTLGGKYLDRQNPYLQGMVDKTNNDLTGRINSIFSRSGRTGGTGHAGELATGLAEAENGLRYQNYAQERGMMENAAGRVPGLIAGRFAGLPAFTSAAETAAKLPYLGANYLASGTAGLLGNATTQTSRPSTMSSILNGLGTAASAASMFSDERIKEDIKSIGKLEDGLPIYSWRYKGDDEVHTGPMAQDVETHRPWASGPDILGIKTIRPGAL